MGKTRRAKHGPEWFIQRDLTHYLEVRGWLVERMIGNAFQVGIPDLYIHHPKWGSRWVDVKHPDRYYFTTAQRQKWPLWDSVGIGIWILTAADQVAYDKLFGPPNWKDYWKDSWDPIPTLANIDRMLDELAKEES